jgi:type VI secretion system protein ImpE
MAGTLDGVAFDWIADADGRFGPTFEVVLGGRYGLMPFDVVQSITSEGPADLRDTMWYPVELGFWSGQTVAAFLLARYPGTETSGDGAEKLGRITSWKERPWGDEGAGQRLWTLSDGSDRALLDLRSLVFS